MQHNIESDNYFFEKDETPDGAADADGFTPPPFRPPAGYVVKVRLYSTGAPLGDLVLGANGHYSYSWDDDAVTSAVQLSADGGVTVPWSKPRWSDESDENMMGSTELASQASQQVEVLDGKVTALSTQIDQSVAGVSKIVTAAHPDGLVGTVTLNAAEVGARPAGKVPATDVTGLAAIATDPSVGNLSDYVQGIPLSTKGQPNGVPSLDTGGKIPASFLPFGFGTVGTVSGVGPDGNGDVPKASLITALGVATTTDLDAYTPTGDLAAVATSGSYNDLTNKPAAGTGMLVCNPSTGVWPTRPTTTDPVWWDSVLRSKQVGSDVVPPTGVGGAVAGDHRLSWSAA